jgi:hypothetical protein
VLGMAFRAASFEMSSRKVSNRCVGLAGNVVHAVYIRYFWQENCQTYGDTWCIYMVLANTTDTRNSTGMLLLILLEGAKAKSHD